MLLAQNTVIHLGSEAITQGLPFANNLSTPEVGFGTFLSGILSAILVIAVLLAFLYLIWGAIEWISAGGDKGKVEKARDRITQSIIGLIVLASILVIFDLAQNFLGVNILDFGGNGGPTGSTSNGSASKGTSQPAGGSNPINVPGLLGPGGSSNKTTNGNTINSNNSPAKVVK